MLFKISSALFMADTAPNHLITSLAGLRKKICSSDAEPRHASALRVQHPSTFLTTLTQGDILLALPLGRDALAGDFSH